MSSLFSHIFISVVILLMFSSRLGLDSKKIIILSPFSILPDIDIFSFHRALLHNIFIPFIPFLIFLIKSRRDIYGIICFFLLSHIILDMFDGGIYLLYPFYYKIFFVHIEIIFRNNDIIPIMDYGISNKIMSGATEPMISSENVGIVMLLIGIVMFLIISTMLHYIYEAKKKYRSRHD